MDPDDLTEGVRAFVQDSLPVYEAAQSAAIDAATAFYAMYRSYETERDDEPADPIEAGRTRNDATLEESIIGPTVKVYTFIKDGRDPRDAIRFGSFVAERLIHTEVMDAAQRELTNQMDLDPLSAGWRWKAKGTCAACAAMDDGTKLPAGTSLNRHPNCRCLAEPTFDGVRERVKRETGEERLLTLPLAELINVVGVKKAEKLKSGALLLTDLIKLDRTKGFVPFITEKPLQDATT